MDERCPAPQQMRGEAERQAKSSNGNATTTGMFTGGGVEPLVCSPVTLGKAKIFNDGRLTQRLYLWQTSGAGVWRPGRKVEDLTEEEMHIAEYEANAEGIMLSCPSNALLNSSTRCELAAAILAMTPGIPMHIGIDNLSVVRKEMRSLNTSKEEPKQIFTVPRDSESWGGSDRSSTESLPMKRHGL